MLEMVYLFKIELLRYLFKYRIYEKYAPMKLVQENDYQLLTKVFVCLFVLRFYGQVNPTGSCQARSVYLTTLLLGRLNPLSGLPVLCTFFRQKLTTALLESAEVRE